MSKNKLRHGELKGRIWVEPEQCDSRTGTCLHRTAVRPAHVGLSHFAPRPKHPHSGSFPWECLSFSYVTLVIFTEAPSPHEKETGSGLSSLFPSHFPSVKSVKPLVDSQFPCVSGARRCLRHSHDCAQMPEKMSSVSSPDANPFGVFKQGSVF